jgi:hypothetical protein
MIGQSSKCSDVIGYIPHQRGEAVAVVLLVFVVHELVLEEVADVLVRAAVLQAHD